MLYTGKVLEMFLKIEHITKIASRKLNSTQLKNAEGFLIALEKYGYQTDLDQPHTMTHFLAQNMHESGEFRYFKEVWGPTAAQRRYEGRADLGNVRAGDGKRYMGRGPIQLTGRDNYRRFTTWAKRTYGSEMPDFEANPELVQNPEYGTLAAIWYWEVGNPTGKSLSRYADDNNIEMITRRINGGLNGFNDRIKYYDRAALVLAGYENTTESILKFQKTNTLSGTPDGIVGAKTRMALHKVLQGKNPFEEKVIPKEVDNKIIDTTNKTGFGTILIGFTTSLASHLSGIDWEVVAVLTGATLFVAIAFLILGPELAKRINEVRKELEA